MATKKKAKSKARKASNVKRIPLQSSLPGMDDAKITAIETAALDYAEIRDKRQELTAEESSLKSELLNLMHKAGKTEYKRGSISVKIEIEKEKVKVRVRGDEEATDDSAAEEHEEDSMSVAV